MIIGHVHITFTWSMLSEVWWGFAGLVVVFSVVWLRKTRRLDGVFLATPVIDERDVLLSVR